MKTIRVLGVGVLLSAVVMSQLSVEFLQAWINASAINSFVLAIQSIAPGLAAGTGMGQIAVVTLTLASLGVGLFAAGFLYSPLDDALASGFGSIWGSGTLSQEVALAPGSGHSLNRPKIHQGRGSVYAERSQAQ
jgi:hypothetical protein